MATIDPTVLAQLKAMRPGLSDSTLSSPQHMSREEFLVLQELCEQFDSDHAQGRDFRGTGTLEEQEASFRDLQRSVDQLMNMAPWTLHPDHGCVLSADVDALDGGASRQRFTVKFVAHDGRVLGEDKFSEPSDAMRAYSVRRHSQFGRDHGAGAYVALIDEKSEFDASYLHEGMQTYREQFAKDQGRELAMLVLREDLTSPERRVEVAAATLTDERLDWAVADALGYRISGDEPAWVAGGQQFGVSGMDVTGAPLFSPSAKPVLAQQLIETEGIGTQKVGEGHWRASSQYGSNVVDAPDMLTAGLRALVVQNVGKSVSVPVALPVRYRVDEPLVDAVLMERVAAHYTDYFRAPVSCHHEISNAGVVLQDKFSISGAALPAHPGFRGDGPKMWTMGDVLSRREAVAIARAYPEVRQSREDRAAVLLGRMPVSVPSASAVDSDALHALQATVGSRNPEGRDAQFWAEVQWAAATDLLANKGYAPAEIASAMGAVSPACVLEKEQQNLTTWLASELGRQQALAAASELAENPQVAAP